MSTKGRLFVIIGPSGVGKGTLVKEIMERVPYLFLSISATTRKPRVGEIEGTSYYFLERDDFKNRIKSNEFLEWAIIYDNYYGTLKDKVRDVIERPMDVILEIDVQGARQIKNNVDVESVFVFISPPSEEALRDRLSKRGTETDEEIDKRLRVAVEELKSDGEFDYTVVNDNIDTAVDKLVDIIIKCRESSIID